jgi:hypothetical protein
LLDDPCVQGFSRCALRLLEEVVVHVHVGLHDLNDQATLGITQDQALLRK